RRLLARGLAPRARLVGRRSGAPAARRRAGVRRSAALRALAARPGRELEAVAAVLAQHQRGRERPPVARGEVGEQVAAAVAHVDQRLLARDLALADGARQHEAAALGPLHALAALEVRLLELALADEVGGRLDDRALLLEGALRQRLRVHLVLG